MWTLFVLIINTLPPVGLTVKGFPDEAACKVEARRFCDEPRYLCKCKPSVTYPTE